MTMSSNVAGVACCGNCGSELRIVCTGNCPEPDIVPRKDYIASLKKPRRVLPVEPAPIRTRPIPEPKPEGSCNRGLCREPIAPKKPGSRGRPPKLCAGHLAMRAKFRKPNAATNGATP